MVCSLGCRVSGIRVSGIVFKSHNWGFQSLGFGNRDLRYGPWASYANGSNGSESRLHFTGPGVVMPTQGNLAKWFESRSLFAHCFGRIWKLVVFRCVVSSVSRQYKTAKTVSFRMLPNASKCFQMLPHASKCFQMLPNASKCFQEVKTVSWSQSLCHSLQDFAHYLLLIQSHMKTYGQGFRVSELGVLELKVRSIRFSVRGSGFRVSGFGFRV